MVKILLTGATGFLGSHLLKELLEKHYNIIILKRSFSNTFRINEELMNSKIKSYDIDQTSLNTIFRENDIDIIIHCATNYGRNNENIPNIVDANLRMPLLLLQLAAKHNVKAFINTDTVIDKKISHYSLSKKQFLDWLEIYSDKIKCINLRLEHFYGAFDNKTKFSTYMIQSMLNNVEEIDLTGGEQRRHFIHIKDVVKAFMKIISNIDNIKENFKTFEISIDETISIKDFVLMIKELTGNTITRLNFGVIPYRENEIMDIKTDITELKKLGWEPEIGLREGINNTINLEKSAL